MLSTRTARRKRKPPYCNQLSHLPPPSHYPHGQAHTERKPERCYASREMVTKDTMLNNPDSPTSQRTPPQNLGCWVGAIGTLQLLTCIWDFTYIYTHICVDMQVQMPVQRCVHIYIYEYRYFGACNFRHTCLCSGTLTCSQHANVYGQPVTCCFRHGQVFTPEKGVDPYAAEGPAAFF